MFGCDEVILKTRFTLQGTVPIVISTAMRNVIITRLSTPEARDLSALIVILIASEKTNENQYSLNLRYALKKIIPEIKTLY